MHISKTTDFRVPRAAAWRRALSLSSCCCVARPTARNLTVSDEPAVACTSCNVLATRGARGIGLGARLDELHAALGFMCAA
jgi:hypothetical protein